MLEREHLLRLIAWAGGRCACRARAHRSRPIVLAIDLSTGEAYQQCLDSDCRRELLNGGHVVASTLDGVATAGCGLPPSSVIEEWLR